jgi:hypothetical protein
MIEALKHTESTGVAALALIWLCQNADESGIVSASTKTIADSVGHTRNGVSAAISDLIDTDQIRVRTPGKGRKPNTYEVINRVTAQAEKETPKPPVPEPRPAPAPIERKVITTTRFGLRAAFQSTVGTIEEFLTWCRASKYQDVCIYHIGQIGADRATSPDLNNIALTVQILTETGYIVPGQHPLSLASGRSTAYTATRTKGQFAPRAIMDGKLSATDYSLLKIIKHRQAGMSAVRAIRDGMGISDSASINMMRYLQRKKMIERSASMGWCITAQFERMV